MAKALFGFVGTSADPRLVAELDILRRRVRELEATLAGTRAELAAVRDLDARVASVSLPDEDLVRLSELQHVSL